MFIYTYDQKDKEMFDYSVLATTSYMESANVDFASEEAQVQMHVFNEAYARCDGCRRRWHVPNTLDSWFFALRTWIDEGGCPHVEERDGFDPFLKTINPALLRRCLVYFISNDTTGFLYKDRILPKLGPL